MERTLVLDPLNFTVARVNAQTQVVAGRWSEAQAFFDECASSQCMESASLDLYEVTARTHMGQTELALAALDRLVAGGDGELPGSGRIWAANVRAMIRSEPMTLPEDFESLVSDIVPIEPVTAYALAANKPDAAVAYLAAASGDDFWRPFAGQILLAEGAFELPDEFRKFPGYRALWERDGWQDIARARIANGQTAGLPLNEDGTLVQF